MKYYHIESIAYVQPRVYRVVFMRGGEMRVVQFTVVEHGGITAVQPDTDVFMSGEVRPPREICAAVLAFDRARAAGEASEGIAEE